MGAIKDAFLNYTKWGATKFTDLFTIPFTNTGKTDGLKWHLQEMRSKTADAIAALEEADNSLVEEIRQEIVKEINEVIVLLKKADNNLLLEAEKKITELKNEMTNNIGLLEENKNSISELDSEIENNKFQIMPMSGFENGFLSPNQGFPFGWGEEPALILIAKYNEKKYIKILTEVK